MSDKTYVGPRRGAVSREVLLGTGLVLLIGVSIALTIRSWVAGSEDPNDPAVIRANRPIEFQCELCGHKFSLAPPEFHKQWKDVDLSKLPPGSVAKANCPKCGKPYCSKILNLPMPGTPQRAR